MPRSLRLAITAGAEHYTATMAALLLESGMLEDCDPTMRSLMTWHALEEIEQHIRAVVPEAQQVYLEPHTAGDAGSS